MFAVTQNVWSRVSQNKLCLETELVSFSKEQECLGIVRIGADLKKVFASESQMRLATEE